MALVDARATHRGHRVVAVRCALDLAGTAHRLGFALRAGVHTGEVEFVDDDLRGPDGTVITTDMVRSVGGTASAPSPGWLLRAAEPSCVATLIAMRAAVLEITLGTLEVTVDSVSVDRGILGIDESVPAGPLTGRVAVRLAAAGVDPAVLEELARWGVKHCPVCDAIEREAPVETEVSVG